MTDSVEVTLARIDERTKQIHSDIQEIKVHNDKQDREIDKLKAWRNGLAGAIGLATFLFSLFLKFGE